MILSLSYFRNFLRKAILEATGAMNMLDVVQLKLILAKEKKVEELMTSIRVIKGVATVSQVEPVQKLKDGKRTLDILVSIDSGEHEQLVYIDALARLIKTIPDIITVVIITLNGRPVRDASGSKKIVY